MNTHNITRIITTLCIFCCALAAQGQVKFTVKGNLCDTKNQSIPYANVILLKSDGKVATGSTSDPKGLFSLSAEKGSYKLNISFIGFKSFSKELDLAANIDLGKITLDEDAQMLSDIEVTAKLTERKGDRMVINLANSPLTTGKSTADVLKFAPGVWLDNKGSISINGNSNVRVMINDRDVRMTGEELYTYLETLQADDILKIEVIPTAGAEFEADSAGGVIHITLKKKALEGMNGSVSMSYTQATYAGIAPSARINYKKNKLSLSARYNYSNSKRLTDVNEYTDFFETQTKQSTKMNDVSTNDYHYGSFGAVYDLSENSEVGAEIEGSTYHSKSDVGSTTNMKSTTLSSNINSTQNRTSNSNSIYATAFYKIKTDTLGSTFKVIADYVKNDEANELESDAQYDAAFDGLRNHYTQGTPSGVDIYSVRADFDKKSKSKTNYAFGAKYAHSSINNDAIYHTFQNDTPVPDPTRSNEYRYSESVAAVYGRMNTALWGNNITIGLRIENTDLSSFSKTLNEENSQNYTDFFPSVSISRNFGKDKKHMFALNYSRRISRPNFSYFNPFHIPLSEFSVVIGNPDIRSTYINRYSATSVLFGKYSITAEYTNYKGIIQQMVITDPDNPNSVIYQHRNMDNLNKYTVSASAPIKLTKWWSMNASFYASYNELSFGETKKSQLTARLSSHNTIDFGKGWKGELFAFGITPQISANMEVKSMARVDMGVTKTAFKNKVTFSAYLTDPLNISDPRISFSESNYSKTLTQFQDRRHFSFSVRYNFSAGKSVKVKSVEASDREERSRM